MSIRSLKHRSARLFHGRFHAKFLWRSVEDQQWLDMAPVGREFGSPDYDRLMWQDFNDLKSNLSSLIEIGSDSCVDSKDVELPSCTMLSMSVSKTRIRRLNRRRRKKLRVGEFQEFIFQLDATFESSMDAAAYEAFINAFTAFADANGLSVSGMGGHLPITHTCAWIQRIGRGSPAQTDRDVLVAWLLARPDVATAVAGDFVDGWY